MRCDPKLGNRHINTRHFLFMILMMISQDSTSDYKDSGIEGPEVEAELDSLPSSGVGLCL